MGWEGASYDGLNCRLDLGPAFLRLISHCRGNSEAVSNLLTGTIRKAYGKNSSLLWPKRILMDTMWRRDGIRGAYVTFMHYIEDDLSGCVYRMPTHGESGHLQYMKNNKLILGDLEIRECGLILIYRNHL